MNDQTKASPILRIPLRDLRLVLPFRGEENDIRQYLAGVCVEPMESGGCMLVATDGKTLGAYHSEGARCDRKRILRLTRDFFEPLPGHEDENEEGDPFTVAGPSWDNCEVTLLDESSRVVVTHMSEGELYVQHGRPFFDHKYPDWRRVLPKVEALQPGYPNSLAAGLLGRLQRIGNGNARATDVRFYRDDRSTMPDQTVSIALVGAYPGLVVAIMPIRSGDLKWPSWMPRDEKPAAEAGVGAIIPNAAVATA